ncbi:MAG: hypothetical protein LIR50_01085 [Bacillota bacterium]|nr:hypothetical protein [Bacillota bacterium]
MMEEFKNILLAGIGSAAYTYEKASKAVENMVEKGRLTVDEGKELSQELKRTITKKDEDKKSSGAVTLEDLKELFQEMNFATKDDLKDILSRLEKLEKNKEDK